MITIFKKELLELSRDKKTLMFMILLPMLIFPALFGGLAIFAAKTIKTEQSRVLEYLIVNQAPAQFSELLEQDNSFKSADASLYPAQAQWQQALQTKQLDFVIVINDDFNIQNAQNHQNNWQLHVYDVEGINAVISRVKAKLNQYNQNLTEQKLTDLGLGAEQISGVTEPVKLAQINIADKKENIGAHLGGALTYILLPLCLLGAMYPAIDMGAGEKERGTLEALLIAPVSAMNIVLGKYLTICTASCVAALIAIFSFILWGFIFAQGLAVKFIVDMVSTLGIGDLLLALFMMIPLILFVAAMVLTISIYAKNFKEAQNFMGPLTIFIFVPLIVAMLPGISLNWNWAFVPVSNVALAVKEILKGHGELGMLSLIWLVQFIMAAIMLLFCIFCFKRESVLFRS
ncbi:ABC transporter permease subunit [Catenovulum sp. 2E275]|uniref:ABC transporter permease n=1 Tax=Catenovulum sp. 2E275 TaxID=2980497 RepID=UPI0021D223C4|nr:ABC transporter permease subunit [Catenovulum sp. 2E275]MCU4674598.1 ABC transporter permease subunit [Catenovulum sp. 2E275]